MDLVNRLQRQREDCLEAVERLDSNNSSSSHLGHQPQGVDYLEVEGDWVHLPQPHCSGEHRRHLVPNLPGGDCLVIPPMLHQEGDYLVALLLLLLVGVYLGHRHLRPLAVPPLADLSLEHRQTRRLPLVDRRQLLLYLVLLLPQHSVLLHPRRLVLPIQEASVSHNSSNNKCSNPGQVRLWHSINPHRK